MKPLVVLTNTEEETRELGRRIGQLLQPGMVVGLDGTLGSGKTRLTQGIGIGLAVPADTIVSPTYTLCVPYSGRLPLLHIDAYRIKDVTEVDELGLDEQVEDGVVLVIEWAERIAGYLPPIDLQITIDQPDQHRRQFSIESATDRFPILELNTI